jgi:hypothetical protein
MHTRLARVIVVGSCVGSLGALLPTFSAKADAPPPRDVRAPQVKLLTAAEENHVLEARRVAVDATRRRLEAIRARDEAVQKENPGLPVGAPPELPATLPSKFSWEDKGKVSPVKNQGNVGTCWTFADVGAMESELMIRHGQTWDLAEQDLIDCGRTGALTRMETGVSYETENPYQYHDAPHDPSAACKHNRTPFYIEGPVYLVPPDPNAKFPPPPDPVPVALIKNAIYHHGPVAVNMHIPKVGSQIFNVKDATPFQETIPLVYDGWPKKTDVRNNGSHIIDIVGWDDALGAWRVKNSWGPGWGDKGFGYIKYGSNRIGMGAAYWALGEPDVRSTTVWEKSSAEEERVDAWPYPYYRARYDELWKQGWRLHQLATTVDDGQVFYSATWRKATSNEVQVYGFSYDDYRKKYDELWKQGWRLHLLDNYVLGGKVLYTAVFRQSNAPEIQVYEHTYDDYRKKYDELWKQGWRLEILTNPVVNGKVLYTAVFRKSSDPEIQIYNAAYPEYRAKYDELWKDGWRLHLVSNYRVGNKAHFTAAWRKSTAGEKQLYGFGMAALGHHAQEMVKDGWRVRLMDTY